MTAGGPGEKMEPDTPSSPDPQHAAHDPDREVENSISEELLRLVLRESEAARLQPDGGGSGCGEEGGGANDRGSIDDCSGWEDDKEGCGATEVGITEVDDAGEDRESDRERGAGGGRCPFPVRPGAEDCAYYIKTGTCKFGPSCKFNHPFRRRTPVIMPRSELLHSPFLFASLHLFLLFIWWTSCSNSIRQLEALGA